MKNLSKVFWLFMALSASVVMFNSCKKTEPNTLTPTTDPGVVINGVKWATRNLDVGGTFVEKTEDYGALYQWGRKADGHESYTSTTTSMLSNTDSPNHSNFIITQSGNFDWRSPQNDALWNAGTETAPVKSTNDSSPIGWRVPTDTEIQSLLDASKVTRAWDNTKKGYTFTDIATGKSIFLPAAGYRYSSDGVLVNVGTGGYYWSNTPYSIYARDLDFSSNDDANTEGRPARAVGRSIRCVAD